jgi:hypothetical protein
MIHYYSVTLMNPRFSRMVTEWKPVLSVPVLAVPLFIVVALAAATALRALIKSRTAGTVRPELFSVLTLGVLAIGAIMAVRNVTWFGIALVMLLPGIITSLKVGEAAPLRRARTNMLMAATTVALAALMTIAILGRPTSWFTSSYSAKSITTLRRLIAHDPKAQILADVRYADWLIWEDPRLFSGRVAYDTSFELLSGTQITAIADLAANTPAARRLVNEFRIWMLYPGNKSLNKTLLHRTDTRVITRSKQVIIAVHGGAQATGPQTRA